MMIRNDAYVMLAPLQGFALQVTIASAAQILTHLRPHRLSRPVFVTSYIHPTSKCTIFAF